MRVAVVGSGPAGLAAAQALVARGIVPEIVDIAALPPQPARDLRQSLAAAAVGDWPAASVAAAQANETTGAAVPRKRYFGSDYVYAGAGEGVAGDGPTPSRAFGGYSSIWGAAVAEPHAADLGEWPAECRPDAGRIARIRRGLPASGNGTTIPYGPQMAALQRDAACAPATDAIVTVAGLAVAAATGDVDHPVACNGCGMCLSGCPYGSIFSTIGAFERLERAGRIRIRRGVRVVALRENDRGLRIEGIDLQSGGSYAENFDSVFLAAGAIASTRIVMRSLDLFGSDVELLDSQKILLPILRRSAPADALARTGPTLAGLFVELPPGPVSPFWTHMQITGVNPMLLAHLGIGPDPHRGAWRKALLAPLLARLMVGWAGLHSDLSGRLVLRLDANGPGGDTLHVAARRRGPTKAAAAAAVRALRAALRPTGSHVPPFGWRIARPGEGNHVGGSLPMRVGPARQRLSSDPLGRPQGFRRLHVVDASGFPSIPSTTMLLLTMANADRIASEAPLAD
jgi:choline dehydrogenase-like flavoprotein